MCSTLTKAKIFYRRLNLPSQHYTDLISFLRTDKKLFSVSNTIPSVILLVSDTLPPGELIAYGFFGKRSFFLGLYNHYLNNNCSFDQLQSRLFCVHSFATSVHDGKFKIISDCTQCEMPCF